VLYGNALSVHGASWPRGQEGSTQADGLIAATHKGSDATTGDKEKFHSGVVVSAMGHLDATSGSSH